MLAGCWPQHRLAPPPGRLLATARVGTSTLVAYAPPEDVLYSPTCALLRRAAQQLMMLSSVPDAVPFLPMPPLQVGDMQKLVELTEVNSDLKNKLRHLLKLSPEKWDEVTQHAMAAVVPDFRWAACLPACRRVCICRLCNLLVGSVAVGDDGDGGDRTLPVPAATLGPWPSAPGNQRQPDG